MLMICDGMINNCDRMTMDNFMHNKTAMKYLVRSMVNVVNETFQEK